MTQDLFNAVILIVTTAGGLAALRAWVNSKAARELGEELIEDVTEALREHIVVAAAEAAQQVIEKLPKKRLAKSADPEAGDPAVAQ